MKATVGLLACLFLSSFGSSEASLRNKRAHTHIQKHHSSSKTAEWWGSFYLPPKNAKPLNLISEKDYTQPWPIMDALRLGAGALEVDVQQYTYKNYLKNTPYVGETILDWLLLPDTFEEAYVDPLVQMHQKNGGKCFFSDGSELKLIVDLKTDFFGSGTIENINAMLASHPEVFSHWTNGEYRKGCVQVIATGWTWPYWMLQHMRSNAFWGLALQLPHTDLTRTYNRKWGAPVEKYSDLTAQEWPIMSVEWKTWDSDKAVYRDPTPEEIKTYVAKLLPGQVLRFLNTEEKKETAWKLILDNGDGRVMLDTDQIFSAAGFLKLHDSVNAFISNALDKTPDETASETETDISADVAEETVAEIAAEQTAEAQAASLALSQPAGPVGEVDVCGAIQYRGDGSCDSLLVHAKNVGVCYVEQREGKGSKCAASLTNTLTKFAASPYIPNEKGQLEVCEDAVRRVQFQIMKWRKNAKNCPGGVEIETEKERRKREKAQKRH